MEKLSPQEAMAIVIYNDVITPESGRPAVSEKILAEARYVVEQAAKAAVKAATR
jgi:hypothetical protein